jgi:hypothetical protein
MPSHQKDLIYAATVSTSRRTNGIPISQDILSACSPCSSCSSRDTTVRRCSCINLHQLRRIQRAPFLSSKRASCERRLRLEGRLGASRSIIAMAKFSLLGVLVNSCMCYAFAPLRPAITSSLESQRWETLLGSSADRPNPRLRCIPHWRQLRRSMTAHGTKIERERERGSFLSGNSCNAASSSGQWSQPAAYAEA